ncbi:hypothetical protein BKI52_18310 [marine bacterium AO1-C]|nr:hypothetical protein BKI52_18310 [marine bacterium AO1-C]
MIIQNRIMVTFPNRVTLPNLEVKFSDAPLSDEEFLAFCEQNRDLRIERTKEGKIIIMSPTKSNTGNKNSKIIIKLGIWNEQASYGEIFDSSTGFTLPDGAIRSPDASIIAYTRWNQLSESEKNSFAPICPEFIVELKAGSDSLSTLQAKMQEWLNNGVLLGWLIDPDEQKTYIYRPKQSPETIEGFDQRLSGEEVLKGFEFDLGVLK